MGSFWLPERKEHEVLPRDSASVSAWFSMASKISGSRWVGYTDRVMWESAPPIAVKATERTRLNQLVNSPKTPQKVAFRAMVVLGAGDGVSNNQLAQQLSTSRPTILKWRQRFEQSGVDGLLRDAPRPGRNKQITAAQEAAIVEATLSTTPRDATHWSVRTMAQAQGVSHATVHRIWRAYGLQPHRVEAFKLSKDPQFGAKVRDIVGLYLDPPERALVLSVDEKPPVFSGGRGVFVNISCLFIIMELYPLCT